MLLIQLTNCGKVARVSLKNLLILLLQDDLKILQKLDSANVASGTNKNRAAVTDQSFVFNDMPALAAIEKSYLLHEDGDETTGLSMNNDSAETMLLNS